MFGVVMIVLLIAPADAQKRLADPNDKTAVPLHEVPELFQLRVTPSYQVTILRQSGNVQASYIITGTAAAAVAHACATFRRAGIAEISVHMNQPNEFRFSRLFYDPKGRASGKKIAWAIIEPLDA